MGHLANSSQRKKNEEALKFSSLQRGGVSSATPQSREKEKNRFEKPLIKKPRKSRSGMK